MSVIELRGIEGVVGREPIGAVLRVGIKGPKGPTERDRFYVVHPHQANDKVRPLHEAFAAFNTAKPEHRRSIEAVLVHAAEAEAFHYRLQAWRLHKGQDPDAPTRGPACRGDGVTALRTVRDVTTEIPCPHRLCQYRLGKSPMCKPLMRILFRPVWAPPSEARRPMPTPLMVFESHSWNSVEAWVGFFRHIREQAEHLGVANPSLYGFPLRISLTEQTRPSEGTRFPVVTPSPETDVQTFLLAQQVRMTQLRLGAPRPVAMLDAAAHDAEDAEVTEVELSGAPGGSP